MAGLSPKSNFLNFVRRPEYLKCCALEEKALVESHRLSSPPWPPSVPSGEIPPNPAGLTGPGL